MHTLVKYEDEETNYLYLLHFEQYFVESIRGKFQSVLTSLPVVDYKNVSNVLYFFVHFHRFHQSISLLLSIVAIVLNFS